MKKKICLLLVGVLTAATLSLTACGGGKEAAPATTETTTEAPAKEEAVEEVTEEAADGAVSDATWADLQDMYAKLVEAFNATADLYNDDSVEADAEIEDALNTAKDLMEQIGDVDRVDVTEENATEWVDAMLAVNDIFATVIDNVQVAGAGEADDYTAQAQELAAQLTEAYAGVTDNEDTYAYLGFADNFAALLFYDTTTNESGSFVGECTIDEENAAFTITDETLGVTMTFIVTEDGDGYVLDMGDVGTAYVEPVDINDFAQAYVNISLGTEPQF